MKPSPRDEALEAVKREVVSRDQGGHLGGARLAQTARECEQLVRGGGLADAAPLIARMRRERSAAGIAANRSSSDETPMVFSISRTSASRAA